jgi:hypothetical protein
MMKDSPQVTLLARIIGRSLFNKPYNNQQPVPMNNIRNIPSERSSVLRVLHVLITWGTNAPVVREAAKMPRNVRSDISISYG